MEITLIPRPCPRLLADVLTSRASRLDSALRITAAQRLEPCEPGPTGPDGKGFRIAVLPPPRFLVFGQGEEATVFAGLVRAAGYPHLLLSPDPTTLAKARSGGMDTRQLHWPALPTDLQIDGRSAVVLFFHDHDWEPPILAKALDRRHSISVRRDPCAQGTFAWRGWASLGSRTGSIACTGQSD
ncbi:hypothetical protein ACFSYD_03105 [Paracoccus aerius]